MANPTVFVCGATGAQGGHLARRLRAIGWGVHTTVRTPESPAAQSLSSIGVKITPGDWDDEATLKQSIAGCQMLFLNLFPTLNDFPHELKQAQAILAIAKAAGVTHVVYSSSPDHTSREPSSDPNSISAHARASKRAIEQATREAGFAAWTVLRPAYFMTNLVRPNVDRIYPGATDTGVFTLAIRASTALPLIDVDDIAKFAVAAFQDPGRFHGAVIDLASETVAIEEIIRLLSRAAGRRLRAKYLSDAEIVALRQVTPFVTGQVDLRDLVESIDFNKAKGWGVDLGTFAEFLERAKHAVVDTYRTVSE